MSKMRARIRGKTKKRKKLQKRNRFAEIKAEIARSLSKMTKKDLERAASLS